jgi:uncharacterized OsmC-like protein
MTASVLYNGELRTVCTHLKSGSYFETDAPTDLLATSLAVCMITVMGIKARNTLGFDLTGIKADVLKIMKSEPRRVGGIEIAFHIPEGLVRIDDKTKAILINTGMNCPVFKSIHPDIEVKVDWGDWG